MRSVSSEYQTANRKLCKPDKLLQYTSYFLHYLLVQQKLPDKCYLCQCSDTRAGKVNLFYWPKCAGIARKQRAFCVTREATSLPTATPSVRRKRGRGGRERERERESGREHEKGRGTEGEGEKELCLPCHLSVS